MYKILSLKSRVLQQQQQQQQQQHQQQQQQQQSNKSLINYLASCCLRWYSMWNFLVQIGHQFLVVVFRTA
jgi:protein subunit release factor B